MGRPKCVPKKPQKPIFRCATNFMLTLNHINLWLWSGNKVFHSAWVWEVKFLAILLTTLWVMKFSIFNTFWVFLVDDANFISHSVAMNYQCQHYRKRIHNNNSLYDYNNGLIVCEEKHLITRSSHWLQLTLFFSPKFQAFYWNKKNII